MHKIRLVNEYMELMIIAVMNSWFALLFVCLRPFVLINGTHMCSDVPTPRRLWPATCTGQTRRRGEFTLQRINKERGENERVNETEMERGGKRKRAGERKREVREGGGWNRGWRGGGVVIPSCNLVFPRPFCPWAAVPPSSN